MAIKTDSSSFRDPDGFVFIQNKLVFRQINLSYEDNYNLLINSGLYKELVKDNLLISHKEVDDIKTGVANSYKIIKPKQLSFVSYPYEWCFSQLKDAALLTLKIQRLAIKHGMTLKDCSSYNIQFVGGKPIHIDTLSFERYVEEEPWKPYRQFCQHFLAPLALARDRDLRMLQLLRFYLDGIPIDLAVKLLSIKTFILSPSLNFHLRLQSSAQNLAEGRKVKNKQSFSLNKKINGKFNRNALHELMDNLESIVSSMTLKDKKSLWLNYYGGESYRGKAFESKVHIVEGFLKTAKPRSIWDLGANTGFFSRLTSKKGIYTISSDNDPVLVENNYIKMKTDGDLNILPLVIDLANPSPSQGFANEERMSLIERGPADMVLALALIHHLAIANNINFDLLAKFLSKITKWLVIEFVPKTDKMVRLMLSLRKDIFSEYNIDIFEKQFSEYFTIKSRMKIKNSLRTMYLMQKK